MDFGELLRLRRMTRSFAATPVADDILERVLAAGLRAPSAGNTQGTDLVVLVGAEQVARYWDATLPAERRAGFAFPGLLRAPVLVVAVAAPGAYTRRYGEADKASTGLSDVERWPVPYWHVDAAFSAMLVQLAAIDAGLAVLFFGIFDHVDALRAALGIPEDREPIGTIAIGWPDVANESPGRSANRPRRELDEVVHRGGW